MQLSQTVDREQLQEECLALAGQDDVLSRLQMELYPDEAVDFIDDELKSKKGAVVSSYAGSRKVKGGEALSNKEYVLDWQVLSEYRLGERGALRYIRHVEAALEGERVRYQAEGGTRHGFELSVSSDQFQDEHKGVWVYLVKVRAKRL